MSTSKIANILESSKELDLLRKQQEDVLTDINKLHMKLKTNPEIVEKPGDLSLSKLMNLYIQARDLSAQEVRVSDILLAQLDTLLSPNPPSEQQQGIGDNEEEPNGNQNDFNFLVDSPSMNNQVDNLSNTKVNRYEVINKEASDEEKNGGQS